MVQPQSTNIKWQKFHGGSMNIVCCHKLLDNVESIFQSIMEIVSDKLKTIVQGVMIKIKNSQKTFVHFNNFLNALMLFFLNSEYWILQWMKLKK